MKLCVIPPTSGLSLAEPFEYQLGLAHMVVQSTTYRDLFRAMAFNGKKIILDNSLWELGHALDPRMLKEACYQIGNVFELILPDDLKNADNTIRATEEFLMGCTVKDLTLWQRNFVVPHGKDREDFIRCYDYFLGKSYTHTIGLPKVLDDIWEPGGRVGCLLFLEASGRVDPTRQYHCLGIRKDPIEMLLLSRFKWLRSLDTALPVHAGLMNVRFDEELGLSRRRTKRPDDYFTLSQEELLKHLGTIEHNIALSKAWCEGRLTINGGGG